MKGSSSKLYYPGCSSLQEVIPTPKKPEKLPIVLSPEEVLQFLRCVWNIKHRTIMTVCYAAGLHVSEAVCMKVTDIDSKRMVVRVEQGKGRIDRYVMLSPKLLQILRDCWRVDRPQGWLFPGDQVGNHIGRHTIEDACQKARRRCRIRKPINPHRLRHSFAVHLWSRAPMCARSNCCWFIAAWLARRPICGSPLPSCALPRTLLMCSRRRLPLRAIRSYPGISRATPKNGSAAAGSSGCIPLLRYRFRQPDPM